MWIKGGGYKQLEHVILKKWKREQTHKVLNIEVAREDEPALVEALKQLPFKTKRLK